MLCKELKRNFISCEIHPEYYKMIQDRIDNNWTIRDEFRLNSLRQKKFENMQDIDLFSQVS